MHNRLFHLMVTAALDTPRITYDSFVDIIDSSHGNIEEEDVANALDILGRPFKKKDFETDDMVRVTSNYALINAAHIHRTDCLYSLHAC